MKLRTATQDKKHFSSTVCGFSIAVLFQEQQIFIFKISNNSWSGSNFLLLKKQITYIYSTSLQCDREKTLTVSFDSSSGFTSSEQEAVLPGSQGVAPKLINPASGQLWELCLSLPWHFEFWAKSKQRQFGFCSALPKTLCSVQWCLLPLSRNLRHSKTSINPMSNF